MRKILVIILFAVAGVFAGEWGGVDAELHAASTGYSSLGRVEVSALDSRLSEDFFIGTNFLRFDIRTSYDDGEYDLPPVSLGAVIVATPALGLTVAALFLNIPYLLFITAPVAFLASGELGYRFLDFKYFKLSVFESHVFEWWLYKKNDKRHMDEVGWGQELGLEMAFPYVSLDIGAQFEITNKQKGIGWFAKVRLLRFLK